MQQISHVFGPKSKNARILQDQTGRYYVEFRKNDTVIGVLGAFKEASRYDYQGSGPEAADQMADNWVMGLYKTKNLLKFIEEYSRVAQ